MNGYGQVYTPGYAPGQLAAVGELPKALKDWASTETGVTVIGVGAGVALGEWFGSIVSEYFAIDAGWASVGAKAVSKGILSFVLFFIGRKTGGMTRILLNGVTIGALASIIGDVVSQFAAPGFGLGAFVSGNTAIKGITIKANPNPSNIGARNQVITSV